MLNLVLMVLCGLSIFFFMSQNINFNYKLISEKINYLILVFNVPALLVNLANAIFILISSKKVHMKVLMLFLNFILLLISLFFMQAWCILNAFY